MYCICLVVFSSILQMHFATSVEGQSVRVRQYKIYRRYQALAVSHHCQSDPFWLHFINICELLRTTEVSFFKCTLFTLQ